MQDPSVINDPKLLVLILTGQTVLVGLDHLLDHLPTDGPCLARGEVAVVALVEVDTNLVGGLHLELVECLLGLGNECLVACHNF